MNPRITTTLALAALMTAGAAGAASAQEGWYGRADVGYSIDGDLNIGSTLAGFGGDPATKGDWFEGLGMGYSFHNGFRVEGEISHRFNELEATPLVDHGGDIHAWAGMINLYYDFNHGGNWQPYLGVGAGGAEVVANAHDFGSGGNFDDSDTVFAYQGLAGIAWDVTPQLALDVGYRYFVANGGNFAGTPALNSPYSADYKDQAVTVGLRYTFEGPPPPPPPPPPYVAPPPPPPPVVQHVACPVQDFVVYFEWNRSNVGMANGVDGNDVVNRAVQQMISEHCDVTTATVAGYTDTSGSPSYNHALSQRRADAVATALANAARGQSMPQFNIVTEAHGEDPGSLAVPTRDGVRDPRNRRSRVVITFQ